ncbi:MAG: tRNA (adenosine(37)-N6)-threonylcarbamoyltransferase complex ATPase subunit type 1 TsaE [Clostridiales bacterium]|nr:tRNA (adenosine(37)-N6)-threonylcarbamoyltransferase complex ATPase subunit type 1 TsaE [Clostridiales bacterium]
MLVFKTACREDTAKIGEKLAGFLSGGTVIALFGGMGMGKTVFTQGVARGLGLQAEVSSPTFAIVHEYGGKPPLYHFDMYRITSWDDLYSSGFFDYLDSGGILCVEWSENIENALPEDKLIRVTISRAASDSERIIEIQGGEALENSWN